MRLLAMALTLFLAAPSFAQQRPDGWSAGGFATIGQSIYVGSTTSARAFPNISYKSGKWTYGVYGISGEVYETGASQIKLELRPRIFGLITSDAPELAGINRNVTADIGLDWAYDFNAETSLGVNALQEVTGEHDGQEIEVELERQVKVANVPLWVAGALTWQSDRLAGYLYGVEAGEATASRPAYDPGAVVIPSVSVSSGYPLSKQAFLFGSLSYRLLPDEVSNSPIVVRDDQVRLSLGINYSF